MWQLLATGCCVQSIVPYLVYVHVCVCAHAQCALRVYSMFFSVICFYWQIILLVFNYCVHTVHMYVYYIFHSGILSLCINFTLLLIVFFSLYMNIKLCIPCSVHLQLLMEFTSPAVHFKITHLVLLALRL